MTVAATLMSLDDFFAYDDDTNATIDMPPPRLVVEVVSPGKKNIDCDYRYKRSLRQKPPARIHRWRANQFRD